MFTAHQYFVLYAVWLLLVWVILVPGVIVLLVPKVIHGPLVFPYHVAVSGSLAPSTSLAITYRLGVKAMSVDPSVGAGPV